MKLVKLADVIGTCGKSRSQIYVESAEGLFPPPIRIGARAVAWRADEIDAVMALRAAGADESSLRRLVRHQLAQRERVGQAVLDSIIEPLAA